MENIIEAFNARKRDLVYYTAFSFLNQINETQVSKFVEENFKSFIHQKKDCQIYCATIDNKNYFFFYKFLTWDSDFFKIPIYKLYYVLHIDKTPVHLELAVKDFISNFCNQPKAYLFCEIPVEDTLTLQCLSKVGFKIVETRLNYYKDDISSYNHERYPIKEATINDEKKIGFIAASCRNDYDRIHADFDFSNEIADQYLQTYAENAVKGFCDLVILPNELERSDEAFLAINFLKNDILQFDSKLARITLTAVSNNCKGWHIKLVSETIYIAKQRNIDFLLMTTQATNRAVIRTCEKLNFKLGATSTILTFRT